MNHREYPITPSQQAINGALSIFVEGGRKDDARKQLVGLSVLRHASEEQMKTALSAVAVNEHLAAGVIQEMLAR